MKLQDLMEADKNKGTYAGVHFTDDTVKRLRTFGKENKIPNRTRSNKFHTTVLYSRKYLPKYEPAGDIDMTGKVKDLEIWPSQPDEDGKVSHCLVLTYDCPELVKRHKTLMDEHKATYDFDEYKPHVTLSYDAGEGFDTKLDLSKIGDIDINKEYGEELNLTWAKDNTSKS